MKQRLWLLVILLPVAYLVWMAYSGVELPGESWPGPGEADARRAVVKRASLATIAGSTMLETGGFSEIPGERRVSGDQVTALTIFRRRLDLDGVPMDDARGGPVRPLLALSDAQARILTDAGFQAVRGGWTATGNEVKQPLRDPDHPMPMSMPERVLGATNRPSVKVRYAHRTDSGGGSGGFLIDLDAPRLTSYRMYLAPGTAATLFVRNDYDQATNTIYVEFSWSDRTQAGVEPSGADLYRYREWIEEKD